MSGQGFKVVRPDKPLPVAGILLGHVLAYVLLIVVSWQVERIGSCHVVVDQGVVLDYPELLSWVEDLALFISVKFPVGVLFELLLLDFSLLLVLKSFLLLQSCKLVCGLNFKPTSFKSILVSFKSSLHGGCLV